MRSFTSEELNRIRTLTTQLPPPFTDTYWTKPLNIRHISHARARNERWTIAEALGGTRRLFDDSVVYIECRHCGEYRNLTDNALPCRCSQHRTCGLYVTNAYAMLGFCKEPIHCVNCCTCIFCPGCKKLITPSKKQQRRPFDAFRQAKHPIVNGVCQTCFSCTACCKCRPCTSCGAFLMIKNSCSSCRDSVHHADCCDSPEILPKWRGIRRVIRPIRFWDSPTFATNRTHRFASIESEIDQFTTPSTASCLAFNQLTRKWGSSVVSDGSIPNGHETCTAPANGDLFTQQVADLAAIYQNLGANVTIRCGMHVHVDARDFTYHHLINLIAVYAKVEPALFAMLPPYRRINRFCIPCRDTLSGIAQRGDRVTSVIRDPELAHFYKDKKLLDERRFKPSIAVRMAAKLYNTSTLGRVKGVHKTHDNQSVRYMALNLHAWVYQRTVEFRHAQGSSILEHMNMWPQVVATVVEYAHRTPLSTINKLPRDPVQALLEIVKPHSWSSAGLREYVRQQIELWSPDWANVWPIIRDCDEDQAVVPLPMKRTENGVTLNLAFDLTTMRYTYAHAKYLTWDHQWGPPMQVDPMNFRYATPEDLFFYAEKKSFAWFAPSYCPSVPASFPPPQRRAPQPSHLSTSVV